MMLYSSPAEIIKAFLIKRRLGTLPIAGSLWPIYANPSTPEEYDRMIGVFDTLGRQDGRLMRTGEVIEFPGIQILIRTPSPRDGWHKAARICHEFEIMLPTELLLETNYVLQAVHRTRPITPIIDRTLDRTRVEHEAKGNRTIYLINAIITVRDNSTLLVIPEDKTLLLPDPIDYHTDPPRGFDLSTEVVDPVRGALLSIPVPTEVE